MMGKRGLTFFQRWIAVVNEQKIPGSLEKGIIKTPHKKKEMDGKYLPLPTNRPLPTK